MSSVPDALEAPIAQHATVPRSRRQVPTSNFKRQEREYVCAQKCRRHCWKLRVASLHVKGEQTDMMQVGLPHDMVQRQAQQRHAHGKVC